MIIKNGDLPASPVAVERLYGAVCNSMDGWELGSLGLTKREHFAGLAMQGLLATVDLGEGFDYDEIADDARRCADALLAELAKTEEA